MTDADGAVSTLAMGVLTLIEDLLANLSEMRQWLSHARPAPMRRLIGITEVTYGTALDRRLFRAAVQVDRPGQGDAARRRIRCSGKGAPAQGAYYDRSSVAGGFEIPLDIQSAGFWLHGLMGAPTIDRHQAPVHARLHCRRHHAVEDPGGRAHAAGDAVLSALSRRQLQRLLVQPCRRAAWRRRGSTSWRRAA